MSVEISKDGNSARMASRMGSTLFSSSSALTVFEPGRVLWPPICVRRGELVKFRMLACNETEYCKVCPKRLTYVYDIEAVLGILLNLAQGGALGVVFATIAETVWCCVDDPH